jgi:hypothetical protein
VSHNQTTYIINPNIDAIELYDTLCDRLSKANALAQFTLTESMGEHLNDDIRNYLWALSQLVYEAWELNQKLSHVRQNLAT